MPFSEKMKKEVREKSEHRCVLCGERIVEIHHIIPQNQGGKDEFENAVALCSQCHTIYGNNPNMQEKIREKRKLAYEKHKEKMQLLEKHRYKENEENIVTITCYISEKENFEQAAQKIFNAIVNEKKKNKKSKIELIVKIDGHRNEKGGFDNDMFELQMEFLTKSIFKYLYKMTIPLASIINNDIIEDFPISHLRIANSEDECKKLSETEKYIKLN